MIQLHSALMKCSLSSSIASRSVCSWPLRDQKSNQSLKHCMALGAMFCAWVAFADAPHATGNFTNT
eukprot:scaffold5966_cov118-Cylindrotheca_fusiformis.AAC.30